MSSIELLTLRAHVLWSLRSFFHQEGFLEIEVPQIVVSPGLEVHLQAFQIQADGSTSQPLRKYLHTSPEYALKRVLSKGLDRIYHIGPCYRDELPSTTHSPEFTMLEWYMKNQSLEDLMQQCERLIRCVAESCANDHDHQALVISRTLNQLPPKNISIDLAQPFERLSVRDAFIRYAHLDLHECVELEDFLQASQHLTINNRMQITDWDTLYFQIFMDYVEPQLGHDRPTFLYNFPASQSALARIHPTDPRWALRFELFAGGLELANAFDELSDPQEQRARFIQDQHHRQILGSEVYPIDEVLLSSLETMGQCVGIAVGFDRLLMLLFNADHIDQVRTQAWRDL